MRVAPSPPAEALPPPASPPVEPSPAPLEAPRFKSPCEDSKFLVRYAKAGMLSSADDVTLLIKMRVDLHGLDCGAPDGYGHDMVLQLELNRADGRCEIAKATASSVAYDATAPAEEVPPPWQNEFVVKGRIDLSDPKLERVELRDNQRREAVLLLPDGYYFYEKIVPPGVLRAELKGEQGGRCCYGYTNADSAHWPYESSKEAQP